MHEGLQVNGEAKALPVARFSTDEIEPGSRFDSWRDAVAGLYDVSGEGEAENFRGQATSLHFGSLIVGQMDASPATYERSRRRIRLDELDHFVFGVSGSGGEGRVTGQDMSQPLEMPNVALDGFCLIMPRHLALAHLGEPSRIHGSITNTAAAGLLSALLTSVAESATQLSAGQGRQVANAIMELLGAAVRCEGSGPSRFPRVSKRAAAEEYIEANLGDPSLCPDRIAREIAVSRSVLYNLFKERGGVVKHILLRRLAWAGRLLADNNELRISDIAALCCFSSESQFSRAFRTWSGSTPRDARKQGRGFMRVPPSASAHAKAFTFNAWVRALGGGL
jgi:AraC-like DNA-binding protein